MLAGLCHSPHPITGQCSWVAALQYGAKCPKSHLLLMCHLRTGVVLHPAGPPRPILLPQMGSAARGEICLPADLPAPLAHTAHGNRARLWKARAGWQQQQWQQHVLHNKLQSFTCPGMQSSLQSNTLLALQGAPSVHGLWWSGPETPIPRKSGSVMGKGTHLGSSLYFLWSGGPCLWSCKERLH